MGFKNLLISFFLAGLFALSLLNFIILSEQEFGSNQTIFDDTPAGRYLNESFGDLSGNLSETQNTAETQRESFEDDVATLNVGDLLFGSIRGVGKVFSSSTSIFSTLLVGGLVIVLGVSATVVVVILAILVFTLIMDFWKVLKSGE